MRYSAVAGLVAALTLSASVARAQNLVTNGSFETGDLSGWTEGPGTCLSNSTYARLVLPSYDPMYVRPVAGSWMAGFANVSCQGTLAQSLMTTAGQQYFFTAFAHNQTDNGSGPSSFDASVSGDPTFGITHDLTNDAGWVQVSGYFTGTGDAQTLLLSSSYSYVDVVSITTAPEPSSLALLGTGLLGLVPWVRRRMPA